jgi:hypothetical protein
MVTASDAQSHGPRSDEVGELVEAKSTALQPFNKNEEALQHGLEFTSIKDLRVVGRAVLCTPL